MRYFLVLFLIVISGPLVFAQNSPILKCQVDNKDWKATFVIDGVGTGFLKFKKSDIKTSFTCALRTDRIHTGQRDISPNVRINFSRGACDPALGKLEEEIFKDFLLIVNLIDINKPQGRVQWLRKKDVDSCVIQKMSLFEIELSAKKMKDGTLKRKSASEPK